MYSIYFGKFILCMKNNRVGNESTSFTIFFLHIPKTAGSTLISFIEDNISLTEAFALRRVRENFSATRFLSSLDLQSVNVIAGHIPGSVANYMRQQVKRITVLREPVSLVASTFEHFKRDGFIPNDMNIIEYLRSPDGANLSNIQTRWIAEFNIPGFNKQPQVMAGNCAGLQGVNGEVTDDIYEKAVVNLGKYDFVGISERLGESIQCLRYLLRFNANSITDSKNIASYNRNLLEETVTLIRERNEYDIKLYEHALKINSAQSKALLNSQLEDVGSLTPDRRIFLDMDDSLELFGFYQRELWGNLGGVRWTSSKASLPLNVFILPNIEYVFKMYVIDSIVPALAGSINVSINGLELNLVIAKEYASFRYSASFVFGSEVHFPKIEINVPFAKMPDCVAHSNTVDSRELGIAVKWIYLGPSDDFIESHP
jgi:hypothetical protein